LDNLSFFQIILLTEASKEIMDEAKKDKKDDKVISLEEDDAVAKFFGQDIFDG